MKPETATTLAVSLLIAGSALCVGGRHFVDARESAAVPKTNAPSALPAPTPEAALPVAAPEPVQPLPSDPEEMVEHLRRIFANSNDADRTRAMLGLFLTFKPGDWQRVMDAATQVGMGSGNRWFVLTLIAWAEQDPQAAMAWAKDKGPGDPSMSVIRTWVQKDPEAALAFIQSIGDGHEQMPFKASLFAGSIAALGQDLPRLKQVIMAIPKEWRILEGTRVEFTRIPLESLYAWAESFEEPLRAQVLPMVLNGLKGAEAKLAMMERYPRELGPYCGNVYQQWLSEDEAGAMKSLESLEQGPMRSAAANGTADWLRIQNRLPEAMALTKRWPEEFSDNALANLLVIDSGDPKNASLILQELPRVKDEGRSLESYTATLEIWFRYQPEAARTWLAENEVPDKVRKQFEGR